MYYSCRVKEMKMSEGSIGAKTGKTYPLTYEDWVERKDKLARRRKNQARRERSAVYRDLGMKRVVGGLGGVYYE